MPQLPRVAVLGARAAGLAALTGLLDGGVPAVALGTPDEPGAALLAYSDRFGLGERVRRTPEPIEVRMPGDGRAPGDGRGRFTVGSGAGPREAFDAIVAADARYLAAALAAAGLPPEPRLHLGIFHPRDAGVFAVALGHGGPPAAGVGPDLAAAQGRLIGEYLRGRYLPPAGPARSAERAGAYRRVLRRDLRDGHARAAAAGYPLPVPRG